MGEGPHRDEVGTGRGHHGGARRGPPRPTPPPGRRCPPPAPGPRTRPPARGPCCPASPRWPRRPPPRPPGRPGRTPPRPSGPATSRRARATASVMETPPRWLSLTSTASERLPRWLCPPPARTAAFSNARRPGVVLRVSMTRVAGLAAVHGVHEPRVREATPDRWPRKFRAVRSAGEDGPERARDLRPPRRRAPPRRRRPGASSTTTAGSSWREGLDGAGPAGDDPVRPG